MNNYYIFLIFALYSFLITANPTRKAEALVIDEKRLAKTIQTMNELQITIDTSGLPEHLKRKISASITTCTTTIEECNNNIVLTADKKITRYRSKKTSKLLIFLKLISANLTAFRPFEKLFVGQSIGKR